MIVVIGGPSGSGKSTTGSLLEQHGWHRMITVTTREPRPGELDGVDYWFLTPEQYDQSDMDGALAEKTVYAGNAIRYGIFRTDMEAARRRPGVTYVILDVVGLRTLRDYYGGGVSGLFLVANKSALQSRMIVRGDAPESIQQRLRSFAAELATADEFDWQINNTHLSPEETAAEVLRLVRR